MSNLIQQKAVFQVKLYYTTCSLMHNTILNIVILIVSHNIACNFSFLFQKKKKKKSDLINSHDLRSKHNQQKSK